MGTAQLAVPSPVPQPPLPRFPAPGEGGLRELIPHLDDTRVLFGGFRVTAIDDKTGVVSCPGRRHRAGKVPKNDIL